MEDSRQVSLEEARALAATKGLTHIETSAKTSQNVDTLFTDLTRDLMATFEPVNYDRPVHKPTSLPGSHKVHAGGICNC